MKINQIDITNFLSKLPAKRIIIILLSLYIFFIYLSILNSCDHFVIEIIARFVDTIKTGDFYMSSSFEIESLGLFYIFGPMLSLIINISPESFLRLPITAIPLVIIIFTVSQRIYSNYAISAVIVVLIISTVGYSYNYLFFWPHGVGFVLFWLFILVLVLNIMGNIKSRLFIICETIIVVSLNYSSYTILGLYGSFFLIFVCLVCIYAPIISKKRSTFQKNIKENVHYIIILLISALIIFISSFWQTQLISAYTSSRSEGVSSIERLIFVYLNQFISDTEITDYDSLLATGADIFPLFGLIKYLFMCLILLFYLYLLSSRRKKDHGSLEKLDLILISTLIGSILFTIMRIIAGSPNLTWLFIPCILCIPRVFSLLYQTEEHSEISISSHHMSKKSLTVKRTCAIIIVIVLTLAVILSVVTALSFIKPIEERPLSYTDEYYTGNLWFNSYSNTQFTVHTDVFTRGMYTLATTLQNEDVFAVASSLRYSDLSLRQMLYLVKGEKGEDMSYLLLNYGLASLTIGKNWDFTLPWSSFKDQVNANNYYNQIYDSRIISVINQI